MSDVPTPREQKVRFIVYAGESKETASRQVQLYSLSETENTIIAMRRNYPSAWAYVRVEDLRHRNEDNTPMVWKEINVGDRYE